MTSHTLCSNHNLVRNLLNSKKHLVKLKCGQTNLNQELSYTQYKHLFNVVGTFSKKKEYSGRKLVGYSREQIYDVVADVKHYKDFVPFCKKSHVSFQTNKKIIGSLTIGFPPIVESYTSHVTLDQPKLIKANCFDAKIFEHLITMWRFHKGLENIPQSCVIDFYVSFEFKSLLHSNLAHMFFNELVRQMENAFFEEARNRYGKPTIPTHKLPVDISKKT